MENLVEKVINTNLILKNDRIVVGVSGGPDSICLLHVLKGLEKEYNLALFVVHINHLLREEADFEENYVRNFSKKLGLEFFSKKVDVLALSKEAKKSTEEVARGIRYSFFNEVSEKVNANKIAVAHNANDNAETVILNIIRGTGLEGLCGIGSVNNKIIRPLINISRDEIEEYVKNNDLKIMIDKTNLGTVYTRNKVRNIIIPELKKINPNVISTINSMSEIIEGQKDILSDLIDEKYRSIRLKEEELKLNKVEFGKLKPAMQKEILRRAIHEYKGDLVDIGSSNLDNALNIIRTAQSGATVEICKDVNIKISYNDLCFFSEENKVNFSYEIKIPGVTVIPELNAKITATIEAVTNVPAKFEDKNKAFFDIAKVGEKLYVRNKKDGDFFYPIGVDGKKTIKKYFSDLKLDASLRDKVPIISTGDEVVWVVGYRTSKRFLKDNTTKGVIILDYGKNI